MLASVLVTLALLAQAPAPAPQAPQPAIALHVPALEAAGVPAHVVEFCQEHLYGELQRQGFTVLRADASSAERARARAVVVGELVLFPSGFRVTARARAADDGQVLAEHVTQNVPEQRLLDALTEAVNALAPQLRARLAPAPVPLATPAPRPERPLRKWAWIPAAGGAVLLGTGTAFLFQARAKQRELEGPQGGGEPVDGAAVASAGERAQTLSRVSYGLGGALVAAGAALYFLPVERLWGGGVEGPVRLHVAPGGVALSGVLP